MGQFSRALQRVKELVLLHFVVAQRAERKWFGERGWRDSERVVGYRALIRNDGVLAQKVVTMAN